MIHEQPPDLMSARAAAARLGVVRSYVYRLHDAGALAGARIAEKLVFARADVDRLAAEREARPRRGRPAEAAAQEAA